MSDFIGTAGNDHFFALNFDTTIYGRRGFDTLSGALGADTIYGGRGDDHLTGGVGENYLYGGKGHDTFILDSFALGIDHILDYKEGKDVIQVIDRLPGFVDIDYDRKSGWIRYDGEVVATVTPGTKVDFSILDI